MILNLSLKLGSLNSISKTLSAIEMESSLFMDNFKNFVETTFVLET
jgi:hypothetical protein